MPNEDEIKARREKTLNFFNELIDVKIKTFEDRLGRGDVKVKTRHRRPSEIKREFNELMKREKEAQEEDEKNKTDETDPKKTEPKKTEPKKTDINEILDSIFPF